VAGALRAAHAGAPSCIPPWTARASTWSSTPARTRRWRGYSGFQETGLRELLHERGFDEVTVVGLATDYCVKHTALDARAAGLAVEVDARAVRAVDVRPGDGEAALAEVEAAGARVRR
jgi:nicotinamidase/pyrazinamidase